MWLTRPFCLPFFGPEPAWLSVFENLSNLWGVIQQPASKYPPFRTARTTGTHLATHVRPGNRQPDGRAPLRPARPGHTPAVAEHPRSRPGPAPRDPTARHPTAAYAYFSNAECIRTQGQPDGPATRRPVGPGRNVQGRAPGSVQGNGPTARRPGPDYGRPGPDSRHSQARQYGYTVIVERQSATMGRTLYGPTYTPVRETYPVQSHYRRLCTVPRYSHSQTVHCMTVHCTIASRLYTVHYVTVHCTLYM